MNSLFIYLFPLFPPKPAPTFLSSWDAHFAYSISMAALSVERASAPTHLKEVRPVRKK